jgi:hypothetical protein
MSAITDLELEKSTSTTAVHINNFIKMLLYNCISALLQLVVELRTKKIEEV